MNNPKEYELVGGSRDGDRYPVADGSTLPEGHEYRVPGKMDQTITEVYKLMDDGRLHFVHYGLKPYVHPWTPENPEIGNAQGKELDEIMKSLEIPIEKLFMHFQKHGYKQLGLRGFWIIPDDKWIHDLLK